MPWYIGDYLRDTAHLDATEHGAYLLLLAHAWMHGGELPSDSDRRRKIARCSQEQWVKIEATVMEFWYNSNGVFRQKRLDFQLGKANHRVQQLVTAGRASALKRSISRSTHVEHTLQPTFNNLSLDPDPDPDPKKTKAPKRRAPQTSIPENFGQQWSPAMKAWLEKHGDGQVKAHLISFIGKAKAKDYRYSNWEQAFQNAIRDDWAGIRKVLS